MRSINRVEASRCLSDKSPKAARSSTSGPMEIFWGNPMPGTATGRMGVHHDTGRSDDHGQADYLGINHPFGA